MSLKPIRSFIRGEQLLEDALRSSDSLEESLMSGNMATFLNEDVDGAIEAMNKAADEGVVELKKFGTEVSKAGFTAAAKALSDAVAAVGNAQLKPGSIKDLAMFKEPADAVKKELSNATALQGIIANAANTVVSALEKLGIADGGADMSIGEWLDSKAEDTAIPDRDKFKAGVKKAWKPPAGIMNALKGFAAGLFGGGGPDYFGLTFDAFADDLLERTFTEMKAFTSGPSFKDAAVPETEELETELEKQGASPEEVEAATEDGGPGDSPDAKSWTDLSKAYLGTIKDAEMKTLAQQYVTNLQKDAKFADAAKSFITMESSFKRHSLLALLTEKIDFVLLQKPAQALDAERGDQLAVGLAKVLSSQGVEVTGNIPKIEDEAAAPVEDIDDVGDALVDAAKAAANEPAAPAQAAAQMIDDWAAGLSKEIQVSINAKGRLDKLKGLVNQSVEGASKTLETAIQKTVQDWVVASSPEWPQSFFIKGKDKSPANLNTTFTKTLPQAVSGVVAAMMKQKGESKKSITRGELARFTNRYMDAWFAKRHAQVLSEALVTNQHRNIPEEDSYSTDDMVKYRWMKMAGLGGYK